MIELERHIEILLLDNDCVIVPGLGGFVTHHVEARYDEADGTYLPPLRTLGFNPQLKLNDSLLVQSYIEAYDISYPEALRRIGQEVDELRQQLANEGSYELNDIGVLSLNEAGNYLFEPCEAGILTPELYGLGSLEMEPIGAKAEREERKPAVSYPIQEPAAAESIGQREEKTISIKVSWLRNAVAVAAAVIAFFLITPPISNGGDSQARMGAVQSAMFAQLMPQAAPAAEPKPALELKADTANTAAESVAKAISQAAGKAEEKQAAEAAPTASPYCIVLASHVPAAGAEAYVKKLHAEGYEQASVYTHNGIVRVVYGSYKSEAEAYNELRTVRGNDHFEQSWVYKRQ